jgi:hypothetical protein
MKTYFAGLLGLLLPAAALLAGDKPEQQLAKGLERAAYHAEVPAAPLPPPLIVLYERHGHVTPHREGFQHTGAGNIDVVQPAPDVVIITMTGVAVAGAHPCRDSAATMDFDLSQCFDVVLDKAEGRKLKLSMEARVIGLLRTHKKGCGTAEESGVATVVCGPAEIVTVAAPAHAVSAGENLSINDHEGPVSVPIVPGKYVLHQSFHIGAHHPKSIVPHKAASAEFAPDPALDPLWISYWEPFHGANKKDFGFQVILKVTPE